LPTEDEAAYKTRKDKARDLWSYACKLIYLENGTINKHHVKTFVTQHVREILTDVYNFSPANNKIMLRTFLSTQIPVASPPDAQSKSQIKGDMPNLVTDKHQSQLTMASNRIRKLEKQLLKATAAVNAVSAPEKLSGNKRDRSNGGPCSLCNGKHDLANCYQNPNASEEVKKRAAAWRAAKDLQEAKNVNVVRTLDENMITDRWFNNTDYLVSGKMRN